MTERLFHDNEIRTNRIASNVMLALSCMIFAFGMLGEFHIINLGPKWSMHTVTILAFAMIVFYACIIKADFGKPYMKDLILMGVIFLSGIMFLLFTSTTSFLLYGPIMLSIKYYNKRFVLKISVLSWLVCTFIIVLNVFLFYTSDFFREYKIYMLNDIWGDIQYVILYCFTPKTLMFVVTASLAYIISAEGRRLVSEEVTLLKKNNEIETELQATASIQQASLPPLSYVSDEENINLRAYIKAAKEVGGDFYDYFDINENLRVGIVADVSDKGLSAAVFAMKAQTILRYTIRNNLSIGNNQDVESIDIEKLMSTLNNQIIKNQASGMFVTLFVVCVDIRTGVGKFVNAGHVPPYLIHQDGTYEFLETEPQVFLGAIPDVQYQATILNLQRGDSLLMYTDGISDARNADDVVFGQEGIKTALDGLKDKFNAEDITRTVVNSVENFIGDELQFDDMTILSCQYTGETLSATTGIEINAKFDEITIAIDKINEFLQNNKCPEDIRRNNDVVIDELCSNIIDYGYQGQDGKIMIECRLSKNSITLRIKDSSPQFDICSYEDKELPEEPQIGGLGIHLVKQLSDEVSYEYKDGYNIITVSKVWNI